MPLNPKFLTASKAAEESLEFLTVTKTLLDEGNLDGAHRCLKAVAALPQSGLGNVLYEMQNSLANVAQGVIAHHGPNGTLYYTSAHEAVLTLGGNRSRAGGVFPEN